MNACAFIVDQFIKQIFCRKYMPVPAVEKIEPRIMRTAQPPTRNTNRYAKAA